MLRQDLERLFDLGELHRLARDWMGIDPEQLGASAGKGAFAKALVAECARLGAGVALCDAVAALRTGLDDRLVTLRREGLTVDPAVDPGDSVGPWGVDRILGQGGVSVVYAVSKPGRSGRLKLLRPGVTERQSAVQRFLAVTRVVSSIDDARLPRGATPLFEMDHVGVVVDSNGGETLAAPPLGETASKLREVWPLLKNILEALHSLHARGIVHGGLRAENVLLDPGSSEPGNLVLLDAGAHFLWTHETRMKRSLDSHPLETIAPEQLLGGMPTASSDVYAFGVLLYELLAGRPPFEGAPEELMLAHLARDPEPLSFVAPRGRVSAELDELVLSMLDKDPGRRPRDAEAVLDLLETIAAYSVRRDSYYPDRDLDAHVQAVLDSPADEMAAAVLEATLDQGADPSRVAQTFEEAAGRLGADAESARKRLLLRAARLYEVLVGDLDAAERASRSAIEIDPGDDGARASLERVLRGAGRYDKVVEVLLESAQRSADPTEQGRIFARMGHLLESKLEDREQAVVAFAQAVSVDPSEPAYVEAVDRLAGSDLAAWSDVLSIGVEAASQDQPAERRNQLLATLGHWYAANVARPDLALQCFQAILLSDPAHEAALEGAAAIYRRAHQWKELAEVLVLRASAAVTPSTARELWVEAARIRERELGDSREAVRLYEQVLDEDPTHLGAMRALSRILQEHGDLDGAARVIRRAADASQGAERHTLLCRLAQFERDVREDMAVAERLYDEVLREDGGHLEALLGLESIYADQRRHRELLGILERQLEIAVTPHQKAELHARIAALYEEEFFDRENAIQTLESLLDLEPGHQAGLAALERHYTALKRWPALVRAYERHIAARPGDRPAVDAMIALGRIEAERLERPDRAARAFEAALAADPGNREALDALAAVRARLGDEAQAVEALDTLAEGASSPESRAGQYLKAARLLEGRGDLEGAIQRYKRALDSTPTYAEAATGLRQALVAQGDVEAALELVENELARTERDSRKADLCAEQAHLLYQVKRDVARAGGAAARALRYDPSNLVARVVQADVAFDQERYEEARGDLERVVSHRGAFEPREQARLVGRYLQSLARTGAEQRASELARQYLEQSAADGPLLAVIARFEFEHGSPQRAYDLSKRLLEHHSETLDGPERLRALYRSGEAARRIGRLDEAVEALEEASSLDVSTESLRALAQTRREQRKWLLMVQVLRRMLQRVSGDERAELLIEIGDLATSELGDATSAAKSYLAALSERPQDRKVLFKLLRLYSDEKDWDRLIDVVVKLVPLVDDPRDKARYLRTAARVASEELGQPARAIELIDRARAHHDDFELSLDAFSLRKDAGDLAGARDVAIGAIQLASEAGERDHALRLMEQLADLHLSQLQADEAVEVYEAARALDGANPKWDEMLAELYASNQERYAERAVAVQERLLSRDPHRPEPYEALRRLYADIKESDGVWCASQALAVLHRADPDEELYYRRYRGTDILGMAARLSEEDFERRIVHRRADPLLSRIFALVQPYVVATRAQPLEALGLDPSQAIDASRHPSGVVRALRRGAEIFGLELPALFMDPDQARAVSFVPATRPCLVLGRIAASPDIAPARAGFVAGSHLACFRDGFYVRYLISTPAGLKAWMLAAIKLIAPRVTLAAEVEGPAIHAFQTLEQHAPGALRDRLAGPVHRLLKRGAQVDLSRWMSGVVLTTDRVGLVLSDDLQATLQIVEATGDPNGQPSTATRIQELLRYSVSADYLALRERLRIGVDWRIPTSASGEHRIEIDPGPPIEG